MLYIYIYIYIWSTAAHVDRMFIIQFVFRFEQQLNSQVQQCYADPSFIAQFLFWLEWKLNSQHFHVRYIYIYIYIGREREMYKWFQFCFYNAAVDWNHPQCLHGWNQIKAIIVCLDICKQCTVLVGISSTCVSFLIRVRDT